MDVVAGRSRSVLRRLGDLCARIVAMGAAAGLNVLGWTLAIHGPWRLGLLVLILSVQLLGVVLWESPGR